MGGRELLSAIGATNKGPGLHSDGGGLYLRVGANGNRSWVFIWRGKRWVTARNKTGRREIGLGRFGKDEKSGTTLKRARELAGECRAMVAEGIDPKIERDKAKQPPKVVTFADVGHGYIKKEEQNWKNPKHKAQWETTIERYCAAIKGKPVELINDDDILLVMRPLWTTRYVTARRVLKRIELILARAIFHKQHKGPNPARWDGHLEAELSVPKNRTVRHHPAMDYADTAAFLERLRSWEGLSARALELLILTATRTSEVLGARWEEFDMEGCHWIIPAHRMKTGKAHAVPLSSQAMDLVKGLQEVREGDLLFPGQQPGKPLSNMSMLMLLRRHKIEGVTPHGFRSTFRSWSHDLTSFDRLICEQALAHQLKDKVEGAYLRSTGFDKRRVLMQAWADYCSGVTGSNVVALHG